MHKDNQDRVTFLNLIIKKMGYKKYLEIGIDNPDNCFNHIKVEKKIAVDPYTEDTGCHKWNIENVDEFIKNIDGNHYLLASDEFFAKKKDTFDIIFIDGVHLEDQVDKDIQNSLAKLRKGGLIVLHDTIPRNELVATPTPEAGQPWMGTVYRSFWKLRMYRSDLDLCTVDRGTGFSFVRPGVNKPYSHPQFPNQHMSFEFLNIDRNAIMNVIPLETFKKKWLIKKK